MNKFYDLQLVSLKLEKDVSQFQIKGFDRFDLQSKFNKLSHLYTF